MEKIRLRIVIEKDIETDRDIEFYEERKDKIIMNMGLLSNEVTSFTIKKVKEEKIDER